MTGISTTTGLFSGIDFGALTDSLIQVQRRPVARMEVRQAELEAQQVALAQLEANVLSLDLSMAALGRSSTFEKLSVSNSDSSQFSVRTTSGTSAGEYRLQTVRLAQNQEVLSRGFANAETQKVGTGTLTIATGGRLESDIPLDLLNESTGVRRGSIRITDRDGGSATIDLSEAYTLGDVLTAINDSTGISVMASTDAGQIVLTDTSGGAGSLTVAEVSGGATAADLGILGSTAGTTLTGSEIRTISENTALSAINDGNGLRLFEDAPDLLATLSDGTELEINLDGSTTLGDIVNAIESADGNEGKLTAEIVDGALVLNDTTGGARSFTVEDNGGASVVRALGIDTNAAGGTITGRVLAGDVGSVLLRNLNGGEGIDTPGTISLTDRAGNTASLDLSSADSLSDVLDAINSATDGGTPLGLTASLDQNGTGIVITDTTGQTANNLVISDVSGTLATDLGITIDDAVTSVSSGSLNRQYVTEATSLDDWAPSGESIDPGPIRITDSAGNSVVISISTSVETIGDVIDRLNAAANVQIEAKLNSTGDGFEIVDLAGGAGTLTIEDLDGTTAADLRIEGEAVGGAISARLTTVIDVTSDDTLETLVEKINTATGYATASLFETGASVNPVRLQIRSGIDGAAGNLIIDDGDLDLGFFTQSTGQDALLRLGDGGGTSFLVASDSNSFKNVASGLDVNLLAVGEEASVVTIRQDNSSLKSTLEGLVSGYNVIIDSADELTRFNADTNERAILSGNSLVSRTVSRLDNLLTRRLDATSGQSIRSLADLGITVTTGGKLQFDGDRFGEVIAEDPEAITRFFTAEETGFADVGESVLDSLTDPFEGAFEVEKNSIQNTLNTLTGRIDELDSILDIRRTRLLEQFVRMEEALASLSSQQESLSALSSLRTSS